MRSLFSKIADLLVSGPAWVVLSAFASAGSILAAKRKNHLQRKRIESLQLYGVLKNGTVLHGPFESMRHPKVQAIGGLPFAKIIGSYEAELHDVIEEICQREYDLIIDVGSAEGYYAVGLALKFPNTKVIAYDTEPRARRLCKEMSEVNGAENLEVRAFCSASELRSIVDGKRALIISDCESYEKQLFTQANLKELKNADILIETHDFMDISISAYLKRLFESSHKVSSIFSLDDIRKAHSYQYKEAESLSLDEREALFVERRPGTMEWLWCEAKG